MIYIQIAIEWSGTHPPDPDRDLHIDHKSRDVVGIHPIAIASLIAISIQVAIAWSGIPLPDRDRVFDRDLHLHRDLYLLCGL